MQRTLFPGLAATEWVSCMSWPKASKPRHEWTVSLQCLISRDQEYRKRSFCVHCWSSLVHCVEQTQNGLYLQWMQLKFCCILRFSSRSKKYSEFIAMFNTCQNTYLFYETPHESLSSFLPFSLALRLSNVSLTQVPWTRHGRMVQRQESTRWFHLVFLPGDQVRYQNQGVCINKKKNCQSFCFKAWWTLTRSQ